MHDGLYSVEGFLGVVPLPAVHTDWIVRVKYVAELALLVTCSMDSKIKFICLEKCKVLRVFEGHKKGVHSFEFCQAGKFIASCGMCREVIVWSPYTMQLMSVLHGHISPVQEICVDEEHAMLITVSVDKMIKVWDVATLACEQTIHDQTHHRPENRLVFVFIYYYYYF
jgi:WD40 repeat protein